MLNATASSRIYVVIRESPSCISSPAGKQSQVVLMSVVIVPDPWLLRVPGVPGRYRLGAVACAFAATNMIS